MWTCYANLILRCSLLFVESYRHTHCGSHLTIVDVNTKKKFWMYHCREANRHWQAMQFPIFQRHHQGGSTGTSRCILRAHSHLSKLILGLLWLRCDQVLNYEGSEFHLRPSKFLTDDYAFHPILHSRYPQQARVSVVSFNDEISLSGNQNTQNDSVRRAATHLTWLISENFLRKI
jgi:hypothetical protein